MRINPNDEVCPVYNCQQGPDKSCPLKQYQSLIAKKAATAGDSEMACGIENSGIVPVGKDKTTFLEDLGLPFEYVVKP